MKCADGAGYIAGTVVTVTTGEGASATTETAKMEVADIKFNLFCYVRLFVREKGFL